MNKQTEFYLNQYNQQKDAIKTDLAKRLELTRENEKIALQIKDVIKRFDGKVYNKRFDDQLNTIAAEYNRDHATQIYINVKRDQEYDTKQYIIQIEIQHFLQRYNYNDYVHHTIRASLTDYTNGRIKAETTREPSWNEANKNELQKAFDQIDTTSEKLCQMLEAVEVFNAIPLHLRNKIQLPYIYSHK